MRFIRLTFLLVVACGGLLAADSTSRSGRETIPTAMATASSADSEEFRRTIDAYDAAHLANDVTALASFWADDVVFIFSRSPTTIRGRLAMEALVRSALMQRRTTENAWQIDELNVHGDRAYSLITFREVSESVENGRRQSAHGRLLYLWRRQADRSWKITRGISVVDGLTIGNAHQSEQAAGGNSSRLQSEAEIHAIAASYQSAYTRHDAARYGALFTDDVDAIILDNRHTIGRDGMMRDQIAFWESAPAVGMALTVDSIRFITPDLAIVNFTRQGQYNNRGTWVVKNHGGQWLINAIRVMPAEAADK